MTLVQRLRMKDWAKARSLANPFDFVAEEFDLIMFRMTLKV